MVSCIRLKCDYHFIIKELTKGFEGECDCLGENTEKYKTLSVLITKEVKRIDKIEKKLKKTHLTSYNLLIAQDLWQARYQI